MQADLCTAYQIYENVTEGSPVSPVFDSGAKLVTWLVDQGVSHDAADAFLMSMATILDGDSAFGGQVS